MAWARPSSPVSTARSGRTMSIGRKRRSSRRSLGSSPARRNDDLPAPDGPRITNSDSTPLVRIPRSTSRPRRIWASRPKNTAASASSSGAHPRYGARSGSPGGGHGKCSAPIPNARRPSSSRCRPSVSNTTGSPPSPISISVVGPSPANRSQRCHSEVMLVSGTGSSRATHDRLVQGLGIPELGLAFVRRPPNASTAGRSPPHSGRWPAAAPASSVPRAGSRCAGPDPSRSPRPDPAPARSATP